MGSSRVCECEGGIITLVLEAWERGGEERRESAVTAESERRPAACLCGDERGEGEEEEGMRMQEWVCGLSTERLMRGCPLQSTRCSPSEEWAVWRSV